MQDTLKFSIIWKFIGALKIYIQVLKKKIMALRLTRERWRLLIIFMRWRGGFHDSMEKKPFLSIYE